MFRETKVQVSCSYSAELFTSLVIVQWAPSYSWQLEHSNFTFLFKEFYTFRLWAVGVVTNGTWKCSWSKDQMYLMIVFDFLGQFVVIIVCRWQDHRSRMWKSNFEHLLLLELLYPFLKCFGHWFSSMLVFLLVLNPWSNKLSSTFLVVLFVDRTTLGYVSHSWTPLFESNLLSTVASGCGFESSAGSTHDMETSYAYVGTLEHLHLDLHLGVGWLVSFTLCDLNRHGYRYTLDRWRVWHWIWIQ